MLLRLDFSSDTPIYQQVRNQIVLAIADGSLPPGQQLPTIRALAQQCGVNAMTISKAYGLLKQEGYLEADRRAGTIVRQVAPPGLIPQVHQALSLALAQAKAAGVPYETILSICQEVYQ